MKLKIYTKTGDHGKTSLYGGERVWKNNIAVEAYGSVDELNSYVGLIRSKLQKEDKLLFLDDLLKEVQQNLFVIGAKLAGYSFSDFQHNVEVMEKLIDELEEKLPELNNFILPQGSEMASLVHIARCVARRAERSVVEFSQEKEIDKGIIIYLNRFSDLLFEIARFINFNDGVSEQIWKN